MYEACGHIQDLCTHTVEQTVKKKRKKYIYINFYGGFNFFFIFSKKKKLKEK